MRESTMSPRTSPPGRDHRIGASGRFRTWLLVTSLLAAAGHLGAGGCGENEAGAQQRSGEGDGATLRDSLSAWSKRHRSDGWPLSNVGDPALKEVVFLYDASISAQTSLAGGDAESARRLLVRIGREWPRANGLWIDSIDLKTGRAFDQVNGAARVTNGPSMHLALSALTVWAATGRRDDELRKIALTVARSVREQVMKGNGGGVPYGPGEQRFPDGKPYRLVFNPEYQIDAYALMHRMALATGEAAWQVTADKVLDWLVVYLYDPGKKAFWALAPDGKKGYPPDAPGWALSMIGPEALAGKRVDVPAMVVDLGKIPEGVIVTEWLVNRYNGLKRGASYLGATGKSREAARAKEDADRLRRAILSLPIQPEAGGGGLAYAYRFGPGGRTPGEPAERVPTGWGWDTQRGSSRVSADYLLASMFLGHDPVAAELRGVPLDIRPPDLRPTAPRGRAGADAQAQPKAVALAGKAVDDRHRKALKDYEMSRQMVVIAAMLSDPLFDSVRDKDPPPIYAVSAGGRPRPWQPPGSNIFEKINAERVYQEGHRSDGPVTISLAPGVRPGPELGKLRYLVMDPSKNFAIKHRFRWFSEAEMREALDAEPTSQERDLCFECWAAKQPGIEVAEFDRMHGLYQTISKSGLILAASAHMITTKPGSVEITGAFTLSPSPFSLVSPRPSAPELVFKRPLTPFEVGRRQVGRVLERVTDHGEPYEWTRDLDPVRELSIETRVYLPSTKGDWKEHLGDAAVSSPVGAVFHPGAARSNAQLASRGRIDGMVFSPRTPNRQTRSAFEPGWISLRPRIVGLKTTDWPYLHAIEEARKAAGEGEPKARLDKAYEQGRLILDWLSDVEAVVKAGRAPGVGADPAAKGHLLDVMKGARKNFWIGPDGFHILVVGRKACKDAEAYRNGRPDAPGIESLSQAIAFARANGLDAVEPRLSTYDEIYRRFRAHIDRLKAELRSNAEAIAKEEDAAVRGRLEAKQHPLREILLNDSETMSFREGDRFFALAPGYREAKARLMIVEEQVDVPAADQVATVVDDAEHSSLLALIDGDDESLHPPRVELHKRYQVVFEEPTKAPHKLVQVATAEGRLIGYDLRDPTGELVGRLQGRIRIGGAPAVAPTPLGDDTPIRADFFSRVERDGNGPVGEHLLPIGEIGELPVARLVERLRAMSDLDDVAAQSIRPILTTRLVPDRPGVVKVERRDGREPYEEHTQIATHSDPDAKSIRRDYGEGNYEIYEEHKFHPGSARWVPGRIQVFVGHELREERVFKGFDPAGRSSHQIRTFSTRTAPWVRFLPTALRRSIPATWSQVRDISSDRVDTREPGGQLYCRDQQGPGEIRERTYYDVEREQDVFAATSQSVEIPVRTYHAPESYDVSPGAVGEPFVFHHAEHNPLGTGRVKEMTIFEVNTESGYALSDNDAPRPGPVLRLLEQNGKKEPPGLAYRWRRHAYVLGQIGARNQRGRVLPELSEVEFEDERGVTVYDRDSAPEPGIGDIAGKERGRYFIPKTKTGLYYVRTPAEAVVISDPPTREVPVGYASRRFPHMEDLGRVVTPTVGQPPQALVHSGLLPVKIVDADKNVIRFILEDELERPAEVHDFPFRDATVEHPGGHVVQRCESDDWYWDPRHRQWYPRVAYRESDGIVVERRTLALAEDGKTPRIDAGDGRAEYRVETFPRGATAMHGLISTILRLAGRRSDEPCVEVVSRDGFLIERRMPASQGHLVIKMNTDKMRDEFARGRPLCEIPGSAAALGREMASYDWGPEPDGSGFTLRTRLKDRNTWRELKYRYIGDEGTRDHFGRWSHWRLTEEVGGVLRPEWLTTRRTRLFYEDDEPGTIGVDVRDELAALRERAGEYGRITSATKSAELGRVLYEVDDRGRGHFVNRQLAMGLASATGPGEHLPFLARSVEFWPGGRPAERWVDEQGREYLQRSASAERATREHLFDTADLAWTSAWSETSEGAPAGLVANDPAHRLAPRQPIPALVSTRLEPIKSMDFYPDASPPALLFPIAESPTIHVGDPTVQSTRAYYDDCGRMVAETRQIGEGGGPIGWLTYSPQLAARTFSPPAHNSIIPLAFGKTSIRDADFLMFWAEGADLDSLRVKFFDGLGREAFECGPQGSGAFVEFWSPEFDDPIVLSMDTKAGRTYRIVAVRPMQGRTPLWPVGKTPRAILIPVCRLARSGLDLARFSTKVVTNGPVTLTPIERLRGPGSGHWVEDARAQAALFPPGEPAAEIPDRPSRVLDLGRGIVTVIRGHGTRSETLVFDQGQLISSTSYIRNGPRYDLVRTAYAPAISPYLRVPLYIESAFGGWLSGMVSTYPTRSGRLLMRLAAPGESLSATVFPNAGAEVAATGIPWGGTRPTIAYPPFGYFDPASPHPRLNASMPNVVARSFGLGRGTLLRLIDEVVTPSLVDRMGPLEMARRIEEAPLSLAESWRSRPMPTPPAAKRPDTRPSLQGWADGIEALVLASPVTGLPATHPGTPKAAYAETQHLAEIVSGLLEAYREPLAVPASTGSGRSAAEALAGRRLKTIETILAFPRSATGEGRRPVLSSYRADTGASHAYIDEWRAPGIAEPLAGGNVSMARAALRAARVTGRPEYRQFALNLSERVLEFVPVSRLFRAGHAAGPPDAVEDLRRVANESRQVIDAWSRLVDPADAGRVAIGRGEADDELARRFASGLTSTRRAIVRNPADSDLALKRLALLIDELFAGPAEDRRRLKAAVFAGGGLSEHLPETPIRPSGAGVVMWPRSDRFELSTNAEALELFDELIADLRAEAEHRTDRETRLLAEALVARARLGAWFQYVVLPEVARNGGHAPSRWLQRRPVDLPAMPAELPYVVTPNRWTTLGASLAAARAALRVDPDRTREEVRPWLANLLRVYSVSRDGSSVPGLEFAPETFGRHEGRLVSPELTLEFAFLAREAGLVEGSDFLKSCLAGLAGLAAGRVSEASIVDDRDPEETDPVETGDGRVVFPRQPGGWSPTATLRLVLADRPDPLAANAISGTVEPSTPDDAEASRSWPLPWRQGWLGLFVLLILVETWLRCRRTRTASSTSEIVCPMPSGPPPAPSSGRR